MSETDVLRAPQTGPIRLDDMPEGQISLIVFGPGRGEAIVLVLPDGSIGVVDGCREPEKNDPVGRGDPVRELLATMGRRRLRFVCLTHPHADHYPGLGRLLQWHRPEKVFVTLPLTGDYKKVFLAYSAALEKGVPPAEKGGLERFYAQVERFESSGGEINHMDERKLLLEENSLCGARLAIWSCGPAPADVKRTLNDLLGYAQAHATKAPLPPETIDPNIASGALHVHWGDAGLLLTGDLLRGEHPLSGWNKTESWLCPPGHPVQVINVAHHGSEGAHHDGLWAKLQPKLAIVTPFQNAQNGQPPKRSDLDRLASTATVVVTTPPAWLGTAGAASATPLGRVIPVTSRSTALKGIIEPALAINNAVAVSLDKTGAITRLILSGAASLYPFT
ncbi:MAG: MBL fold metallo-hydrolase [Myxococcales bacterium]|jgi:beta-lactamase superfamily II metal-dependent hydrolase|nr:MBL fold metallo-hydrolase [Myxococcales bacterium]